MSELDEYQFWYVDGNLLYIACTVGIFRLLLEILDPLNALKRFIANPRPHSGLSSEGENVSKAERLQVGRCAQS